MISDPYIVGILEFLSDNRISKFMSNLSNIINQEFEREYIHISYSKKRQ